MPAKMQGKITANRPLTPDIHLVQVETAISYVPGQFVLFDIPAGNPSPVVERAFSMANAPGRNSQLAIDNHQPSGVLDFLVKIVPGGKASEYFRDIKIGEIVAFSQPIGFFTLPNPLPQELTFVATGTGLAPFRSMLQWLRAQSPLPGGEGRGEGPRIRLLFGCRTEEDMLFRDEFEIFAKNIPNFSHEFCISRANGEWNGVNGRVTHALDALPHNPPGAFYLCGNQSMIRDARALLLRKGVDPKKIHFEIFFPV